MKVRPNEPTPSGRVARRQPRDPPGSSDNTTPGQVLKIIATDRGSAADIPAWARDTDNELLGSHEDDGVFTYYVRKGAEG